MLRMLSIDYNMCLPVIYIYMIYMYKEDLALNNLQWFFKISIIKIIYIWCLLQHAIKPNQTK